MDHQDHEFNEIPAEDAGAAEVKGDGWTMIESNPLNFADHIEEEYASHEASDHDEDWAEKSLDQVKEGLSQINQALKYAFTEGKNDPKIKQFGDDVRTAFENIGKEIENIFKKE